MSSFQKDPSLSEEWRGSLSRGDTPVSVNILARDEAIRLPRLLSSLIPLNPSQVIIGDTGSSDHTIAVCEFFGAKVIHIPWEDNFSKARNELKSHASEEFCFWIDADEELESTSAKRLKNRLVAGEMSQKDVHFIRYSYSSSTKHQLRIWKNREDIRWTGRVYEKIWFYDQSKVGIHDDIVVVEYPDERRAEKHLRNLHLFEKEIEADPNNSYNLFHMATMCNITGDHQRAKQFAQKYLSLAPKKDTKARAYMTYLLAWTSAFVDRNYQQSVNYLANALILSPCAAELWCLMGDVYWWIKRFSDAYVFYKNAISLGAFAPTTLWLVDLDKYDIYPRQQIKKLDEMGITPPLVLTRQYGIETPG